MIALAYCFKEFPGWIAGRENTDRAMQAPWTEDIAQSLWQSKLCAHNRVLVRKKVHRERILERAPPRVFSRALLIIEMLGNYLRLRKESSEIIRGNSSQYSERTGTVTVPINQIGKPHNFMKHWLEFLEGSCLSSGDTLAPVYLFLFINHSCSSHLINFKSNTWRDQTISR